MKEARYDKLIEAFGGKGFCAADLASLSDALVQALASERPAVINCAIDPKAGTERVHIGNLNPLSGIAPKQ
jgi:oxalyl-CoA decarboxylase